MKSFFAKAATSALLVAILCCVPAQATDVCGNVSGTWNAAGSPYVAVCNITVPAGQTLTIEPGTQVLFNGYYKMDVLGSLYADGTEQDSILFSPTSSNPDQRWSGIRVGSSNTFCRLTYCTVEHGWKGTGNDYDHNGGGLICWWSTVHVDHCTFRDNTASRGGAIAFYSGGSTISNSLFKNNSAIMGGAVFTGIENSITRCTFVGNTTSEINGAVSLGGASMTSSIIANSNYYGIAFAGDSRVSYCDFSGNPAGAAPDGPPGFGNTDHVNLNGDPCDFFNNIFLDPMFVDAVNGNYHLQPRSPCINAGDPTLPHDADGSIADIGVYSGASVPEHHFVPVAPTGLPYAVIVDSARIGDAMLVPGDEIGIFDGDLCVGAGTVATWPLSVTTWQGDTEHSLPGFTAGHTMQFRLWTRHNETETHSAVVMTVGNGNFGSGVYSRCSLSAVSLRQVIMLSPNFSHLISLNAWPPEATAPHVFGTILSLVAAYQDNGNIFIPPQINTIGSLDPHAGYRLFCTVPESLVVTGMAVNSVQEYHLNAGPWHWISYPLTTPADVTGLLALITEHLVIIQDDEGHAWIPSQGINTLHHLMPGKGYMLIVNQDLTFAFGRGSSTESVPHDGHNIAIPVDSPQPTGLPYQVVLHLTDRLISRGPHVIELLDNDVCVGKGFVSPGESTVMITTWQGIPDYHLSGFTPGHPITVGIKDRDNRLISLRADGASQSFGSGAYAELTVDTDAPRVPGVFEVGEGFPNPFNPSVSVPFSMIQAGPVEIRIFNTLGQTIYQSRKEFPAGDNRFTFDSSQLSVSPVSGVYFVELRHGGIDQIRKVLLVR